MESLLLQYLPDLSEDIASVFSILATVLAAGVFLAVIFWAIGYGARSLFAFLESVSD